jgi:hypothetical protein
VTTAEQRAFLQAWETYRAAAPAPTMTGFLAEQLHARFQAQAWTVRPGPRDDRQPVAPGPPQCGCGASEVGPTGLCAECAELMALPETCRTCHTPYINYQAPGKPLGVIGHRTCQCVVTMEPGPADTVRLKKAPAEPPVPKWQIVETRDTRTPTSQRFAVMLSHGPRDQRHYELVGGWLYDDAGQARYAGQDLPYPHVDDRWSVAPLITGQFQAVTVAGLGGGRDLGPPRATRADAIADGQASELESLDREP